MWRANGFAAVVSTSFPLLLLMVLSSNAYAEIVPDQEFTDLRINWHTRLVGTSDYDHTDTDIRAAILALDVSVTNDHKNGFWDTMNKDASRTSLWPDTGDKAKPAHMTTSYRRLKTMALVYSTEASSLYLNTQLKQDMISALDWMYDHRYNENQNEVGNWWDWEIGTPQRLNDITVLLYDELTEFQRRNYMKAVNHFVPDPTVRTQNGIPETGANRADKALVCVIAGMISKNSDTIFKGQAAVSEVFLYVTSGDGFYQDGSFIQHKDVAYNGGYGSVLISGVTNILSALGNSRWRITDPNQQNVYRWVEESTVPLIYRGAMMDNVRGRAISRADSQDHVAGREVIMSIMRLSQVADAHEVDYLHRIVKRWVMDDTTFVNYYTGLDVVDAIGLKFIMSDASIPPQEELILTKVYTSMSRAVHLQLGYGFAISMFSPRITAFENGNGENLKGWYTGIGMTSFYDNDLTQYSEDYWATVDMYRLPGTTTCGTPSAALIHWHLYANPKIWVGGASLDRQASAVGMDYDLYEATGTPLSGKKSWFMFYDVILCMGSGISGGDGHRGVETIIENRRLRNGGTGRVLSVNGEARPNAPGWGESRWAWSAHISGEDGAAGVGYFFPERVTIDIREETRTGSWSEVNEGGSTAPHTNTFLSLSIPHGNFPRDEEYCYVILPGKTAAQVEDYYRFPDTRLLSSTDNVHAVMRIQEDEDCTLIAANFWRPDTVLFIQAHAPLSVIVKEDTVTGKLHVAISEPTQTQASVVVELIKQGYELLSKDADVTVITDSSRVYIQVNTEGETGFTYNVVLGKK